MATRFLVIKTYVKILERVDLVFNYICKIKMRND